MVRCRVCGSAAEVVQNYNAAGARLWQVRCAGCGRATAWRPDGRSAEAEWREMNRPLRRTAAPAAGRKRKKAEAEAK